MQWILLRFSPARPCTPVTSAVPPYFPYRISTRSYIYFVLSFSFSSLPYARFSFITSPCLAASSVSRHSFFNAAIPTPKTYNTDKLYCVRLRTSTPNCVSLAFSFFTIGIICAYCYPCYFPYGGNETPWTSVCCPYEGSSFFSENIF